MHVLHRWSSVMRPVALGAAAVGLVLVMLGAGGGAAEAIAGSTPVYKYATYVGGHGKANPKLSPVTIGIVNQQTAADAPAPAWTTGAEIAEKYMNQYTDGIDGHPVKLVLCKIATTVADATTCGQEFADNNAISAVAAGAIAVGNTALESSLKPVKKPMFFGVSLSEADDKYTYGFILYDDAYHVEAPESTFAAKYLHAKSVSIIYDMAEPSGAVSEGIVAKALEYLGVKTVYSAGYTPSDANLTAPFDAAHVSSTTVLIPLVSGGPVCSDIYLTLKSLGATPKVEVNIPCATPTVASADGGNLPPDWYYLTVQPLPGSKTKGFTSYETIATEYGKAAQGEDAWTGLAFGQVLTIAKLDTEILKSGNKITPEAVTEKARAFKGPVAQGPPTLECGQFAGAPAACNDTASFYENTSPEVFKPIAYWLGPPKGFKDKVTGETI